MASPRRDAAPSKKEINHMKKLPVDSDGYLSWKVFDVVVDESRFAPPPALKRSLVIMICGWVTFAGGAFLARELADWRILGSAVLILAGLGFLVALVSGIIWRIYLYKPEVRIPGGITLPDGVAEQFVRWADGRYGVTLTSAEVATLLGCDDRGNTITIDGAEIMIATPAGFSPHSRFGLTAPITGIELPIRG
ncbi:hypothetical protein ESZ53_10025 [Salinibacterium sp. UTAS2018]|uniref:hypothetical protein n=1 Tax=Salinibacterium sp. UTAS2018 TaxID=2508880 RepID=UPI0010094DF1|nr:hypothetical protein [Salinibacterium sp. UTAS2018]QAV70742.1 hypothetical protein ESZ53_10025 [Salinibacterium sp. UTAS2018]